MIFAALCLVFFHTDLRRKGRHSHNAAGIGGDDIKHGGRSGPGIDIADDQVIDPQHRRGIIEIPRPGDSRIRRGVMP